MKENFVSMYHLKTKPAFSKHLKNIYETEELEKNSTVSVLETVQKVVILEENTKDLEVQFET